MDPVDAERFIAFINGSNKSIISYVEVRDAAYDLMRRSKPESAQRRLIGEQLEAFLEKHPNHRTVEKTLDEVDAWIDDYAKIDLYTKGIRKLEDFLGTLTPLEAKYFCHYALKVIKTGLTKGTTQEILAEVMDEH